MEWRVHINFNLEPLHIEQKICSFHFVVWMSRGDGSSRQSKKRWSAHAYTWNSFRGLKVAHAVSSSSSSYFTPSPFPGPLFLSLCALLLYWHQVSWSAAVAKWHSVRHLSLRYYFYFILFYFNLPVSTEGKQQGSAQKNIRRERENEREWEATIETRRITNICASKAALCVVAFLIFNRFSPVLMGGTTMRWRLKSNTTLNIKCSTRIFHVKLICANTLTRINQTYIRSHTFRRATYFKSTQTDSRIE